LSEVLEERLPALNAKSCSVALCTYNGEKYLGELLDSILSQSVSPDELVIVDDCSEDGTVALLKHYAATNPKVRLNLLESNVGPVRAFQTAIQMATGAFIFLADQDDVWKPEKVELMLKRAIQFSPDVPLLVYSDLEVMNEKGDLLTPSFWKMAGLQTHAATFKSMMFGNVITGCASVINSKMKEQLTSIPTGVLMHDYWIGLIAYGFGNAVIIDQQLVKYRVHDQSVTEKRHANIFWKIGVQFKQFMAADGSFLKKEIDQMILFDQKFRRLLSTYNQKLVDDFVALKHKTLLQKKIVSYLRHTK
jgi:glycosyltransferase involved in cell wall biosynthesis